jgi:hypothetical protein
VLKTGRFIIFALVAQVLICSLAAYGQETTVSLTTNDATSITSNSVVLNGSISTTGVFAAVWFEWGTTTSLGNKSDVRILSSTSGALAFTQALKNLQPHTTYYFRFVGYRAVAGAPNVNGDVKTFTTTGDSTAPATLTVTTGEAGSTTSTSAVLTGAVNGGGTISTWFEWGTTTAFGTRTDVQSPVASTTSMTFKQSLTGLQPHTTYYFRAVAYRASDGAGAVGDVHTFTTPGATSTTVNIPDVEEGTIRSGYVVITPDSSSGTPTPMFTFGTVSGGIVQSQAGIIPTQMTTDASMFVDIVHSLSRDIGVAIVNPNDTLNVVTLALRDENGNVAGTPATVSIAAHGQVAKFVDELFGSATAAGFRGSMRMQSTAAFAVIGFRFSRSIFSTLAVSITTPVPGVPTMTLAAGSTPNSPLAGTIGGLTAILIPQFALSGGWSTQLVLVNNTGATITGRIDVLDATGKPMPVKLNGLTQSTFTYSIPAGGTFVLAPRDLNGQSPL